MNTLALVIFIIICYFIFRLCKSLLNKLDIYLKKMIYQEVTRALADFQVDEMKTL